MGLAQIQNQMFRPTTTQKTNNHVMPKSTLKPSIFENLVVKRKVVKVKNTPNTWLAKTN